VKYKRLAPCTPGDEQSGFWTREQLIQMDSAFVNAVVRTIRLGLEQPPESERRPMRAEPALQVAPCSPPRMPTPEGGK
jgi:hypothetical protein